jgi:hypothetical protein
VLKRIISAVKRVEFVSDRMSHIILRGRWCHIIVLNVHAPKEDKIDDVKDSFYEELEHVFDKFPKNYIKHSVRTNTLIKTTVRNKWFYARFIVYYLQHVSAPISDHLQVKCTQKYI